MWECVHQIMSLRFESFLILHWLGFGGTTVCATGAWFVSKPHGLVLNSLSGAFPSVRVDFSPIGK